MNMGRLVGILMVLGAVAICLIALVWVGTTVAAGDTEITGAVLGAALAGIIVLPLGGIGVFMIVRGGQEAKTDVVAQKQRRLLDLVTSRGEISINDAALELQVPRDEMKNWIYRLVGLGVFSGYINWDDGILFSAQASKLRELTNCKKCGGEVKLVGKGVVKCPYCGTEYFLD
jgi:hypothetical protein